jgi:hypothetical protein
VTDPVSQPARRRRRSGRWGFYAFLTIASFISLCTGHLEGLAGTAIFGLYTLYHLPRRTPR